MKNLLFSAKPRFMQRGKSHKLYIAHVRFSSMKNTAGGYFRHKCRTYQHASYSVLSDSLPSVAEDTANLTQSVVF